MTDQILSPLLWFAAVGSGVMAGVYFTFSVFVMAALAAIPDSAGAAAMKAINRVIVRTAFLPLFFATSLAAGALAAIGAVRLGDGGGLLLAGGATYVVGMFVWTVVFNVPLNNRLDAADPATRDGAALWRRYLVVWTRHNHVRTAASTLAAAAFIAAL